MRRSVLFISFSAKCNNLLWLQSNYLFDNFNTDDLFPTDFSVYDEQKWAAIGSMSF